MSNRGGWATENFANAYRQWIVDRMNASRYTILFDYLYDVPFKWSTNIPRDADREADGRWLRHVFSSESGLELPYGALDWPASFLEVTVALAMAIEDKIMYDPDTPENEVDWFWEMFENADLTRATNDWMLDAPGLAQSWVGERVNAIMERRYSKNGDGGFFPLEFCPDDQREEELWYQANEYFAERYF